MIFSFKYWVESAKGKNETINEHEPVLFDLKKLRTMCVIR